MKVALVHDYLYTYGGAERVLEVFKKIYPQAPVFTAWADWSWLKKNKPEWSTWQIKTSWFDKLPFKKFFCSSLRFLTPLIWSSFSLQDFDLIISSSAWYMAKGVALGKKPANFHLCYCHTPPRYLYNYPTAQNFKKYWWGRLYANIVNPFMRYYDFKSSQAVDQFVCNSKEVQQRIKKFYRRDAVVLNPPLMINAKTLNKGKNPKTKKAQDYFLMVNRLVWPKHTDLAIKACLKLGQKLVIVGSGPEEEKLKALAGQSPLIKFLGYVPDSKLKKYYQDCKAVLYLAEDEDFGIIPVEAAGFGKAVIALRSGGVKETVLEDKTGLFLDKPELQTLIKVLKNFKNKKINPDNCIKQAANFSEARFVSRFKALVSKNIKYKQ